MKKKGLGIFLLICLFLAQADAGLIGDVVGDPYATRLLLRYPQETPLMKLPINEELKWKEIHHHIDESSALIERIPTNQSADCWSNLIAIQFEKYPGHDLSTLTVDKILNGIRMNAQLSHIDSSKVIWNVIEKTDNSVIYEWALLAPYKGVEPQHEISRGFLTKTGFYRVGYAKKNGQLSEQEREKWIKLFKQDVSMVPFDRAENSVGLSLADKRQDLFVGGNYFNDWKPSQKITMQNGFILRTLIPPGGKYQVVDETIDIITIPNSTDAGINDIFKGEQQLINHDAKQKVEYKILTCLPKEIIYTFKYPGEGTHIYGVVRSFITDQGGFSLRYKRGTFEPLKQTELLQWEGKILAHLKDVSVCH